MSEPAARLRPGPGRVALAIVGIAVIGEAIVWAMGHPLVCTCGYVELWNGDTTAPKNSQQIFDWYTPSHVIHGLLLYGLLWIVARRLPFGVKLAIATFIEVAWELIENAPWVIERYRLETLKLHYFGDSVVNSSADVLAAIVGFLLAALLPVWGSVLLVVALELVVIYAIHDSLALMVAMRVWSVVGGR